ncbi:MAG TPA: prolyl oligopeptidase family serine peptidase [Acidisarcina sp.]
MRFPGLASPAALTLFTAAALAQAQLAKPPAAPVKPVVDTYFGQKIEDPYRYMENQKDPAVVAWMKSEADYTRAVLDSMPGRKAFEAQMKHYLNAADFTISDVQLAGKYTFYRKRKQGQNLAALYVREGTSTNERLLFDPNKFDTGAHHVSLDQYGESLDGTYFFVGASPGGSEDQTAHIYETATGRELPESLERFEGASFSLDNKMFYYGKRQKLGPGAPPTDKYKRLLTYAHKVGTDPATDKPIFGYEVSPEVKVAEEEYGFATPTVNPKYVLGVVGKFVAPAVELYIAPASTMETKTGWKKITSYDDKITDFALVGDSLYLVSLKDAPNGKILRVDAADPDLSKAEVVLPGSTAVLTGSYVGQNVLRPAKDALYIQEAEAAYGKVLRLGYEPGAKAHLVTLPVEGSIDNVVTDPTETGALMALASWTKVGDYYRYDPATGTAIAMGLEPESAIDPKDFVSEERKAPAPDGTLIPLSIIYKKGTVMNGENPTALIGYGAYGEVWSPGFSRRDSEWIERGGILAVAHVRGGGEYGDAWHLAGQKLTKPNTWRDFIASAQYLIDHKYTSTPKLGIWSQSAGGILIGRSITERPDLFAAAVDGVPCSDTLRMETGANGPPNIPEFGTVTNEDGFKGLLEMSSYAHIKPGVKYPAVLFTAGANDPRVDPWEGAKMAARMQAANASDKPILLRVNYDAGHGITDTVSQQASDWSDIFTFFLWQFGDKDFQPAALSVSGAVAKVE